MAGEGATMNIWALLPEVAAVVVVAIAAAGVHRLVQRRIDVSRFGRNNEVAGFLFSVVGVIYAVVLGFVVVVVWEKYDAAVDNTEIEVSAVADLYRSVDAFPPPLRDHIRRMTHEYLDIVKDEEWPAMAQGKKPIAAAPVMERIAYAVNTYDAKTNAEQDAHQSAMTQVQRLIDARRTRLHQNEPSVPPILWFALIAGGIATIGFAFLFGVENQGAQLLMTATLAAVVAILFVVIFEFDFPFGGSVGVSPADWALLHERLSLIR